MVTHRVSGQPSQLSTTVSLNNLNVQLTYPTEILPGQAGIVSVQATAKNSFDLSKLVVQIYFADGSSIRSLTSAIIANKTSVNSGDRFAKDVRFNVPADAPRTSIIALVSEDVYVPVDLYAPYFYPYSYWYFPSGNAMNPYFYYVYPPTNITTTDSVLAPLSYVKATTPEYVALQKEYQMLQQQLAQSQADNQKLQQNLQDTTNQKNSVIADLSQQLAHSQTSVRTLQVTSLILAIVAAALGFMLFRARTRTEKGGKEKRTA